MASDESKRWWRFWGGVEHREDDPGFEITLQTKNGRHEPGMRALRDVGPGQSFSVNFRNVPKELLEKCPTFADIAFARLAGEGLAATAKDVEGVVVRRPDGEVVSEMRLEKE